MNHTITKRLRAGAVRLANRPSERRLIYKRLKLEYKRATRADRKRILESL